MPQHSRLLAAIHRPTNQDGQCFGRVGHEAMRASWTAWRPVAPVIDAIQDPLPFFPPADDRFGEPATDEHGWGNR